MVHNNSRNVAGPVAFDDTQLEEGEEESSSVRRLLYVVVCKKKNKENKINNKIDLQKKTWKIFVLQNKYHGIPEKL